MFTTKQQYPYPLLAFPGYFREAVKLKVKDDSFQGLRCDIDVALTQKDFDSALNLAKKAALLYGAPGLFLYNRTVIPYLTWQKDLGEIVQTQAINALTFLKFTKLILEKDKDRASDAMLKNLPEVNINDNKEFSQLENKLIALGELDKSTVLECDQAAEQCIQMCFNQEYAKFLTGPKKS